MLQKDGKMPTLAPSPMTLSMGPHCSSHVVNKSRDVTSMVPMKKTEAPCFSEVFTLALDEVCASWPCRAQENTS